MKNSMISRSFPTFRKLMNAMKNNNDSSQVFKQNHRTKYREKNYASSKRYGNIQAQILLMKEDLINIFYLPKYSLS